MTDVDPEFWLVSLSERTAVIRVYPISTLFVANHSEDKISTAGQHENSGYKSNGVL
jgi:hypothetical protein